MSGTEENTALSENQGALADAEHSIAGRARARARLAADIEAFLRQGGEIQEVRNYDRVDAPRKAESGYSSDLL